MDPRRLNTVLGWFKLAVTGVPQPAPNDFLKSCQGIIKKLDDLMKIGSSSQKYLMNEKQCRFLVKRLRGTLAGFPHSSHPDEKTSLVFQELCYVFEDAHRLIQSCCIKSTASNSERLRAAIEQGDMTHTFAKLLYDVKWHAYVLQSILDDSGDSRTTFEAAKCIGDLSSNDATALMNAKIKDDTVLTERLRSLTLDREPERDLADQLLKHRDALEQSDKALRHCVLLLGGKEMRNHLQGELIGKGEFAVVRETNFLDGDLAVKIFAVSSSGDEGVSMFNQEIEAMEGLGHHPNIVRLYCTSRMEGRCISIMERMKDDLACFLFHKKLNCIEVSLVEKVVLMLEIAEGMRYIHRMHMAHRDLKPSNVLVNLEDPRRKSGRAYSVKIADFSLTKSNVASRTYKDQTTNTGTFRYMAPEVIPFVSNDEKGEFNPTKADVYSFGIMAFEILTGRDAFGEIVGVVDFKKKVKGNGDFRPDLQPGDGPPRLKSLIQWCWAHHHRSRPDFNRICQELRYIKGLLLRGDDEKLETTINFKCELGSPDMSEQVKYVEADGQERKEMYCWDTIGTTYEEVELKRGEHIKQVSGCVGTHTVSLENGGSVGLYCVVSLTIHTNLQSYGPFGDETKSVSGHRFKSGTGEVVGFFGAGAVLLDKLGVWIIPDGQEDADPSTYVVDQ